ncbi:MAG TPA: hypothetical protein VFT37_01265 [Telluria sp.]|nr:hypothetical protein [Telluria sp.]
MKLPIALSALLLAGASAVAAAHPHQVPQPPTPPAPPAPPNIPAPVAPPAPVHADRFAPPALPAPPAMPAMPPAPPIPPIPDIDVPDEVLAACEGKADGARITQTIANGAHITGTCKKRGNVYLFKLTSYEHHTTSTRQRR